MRIRSLCLAALATLGLSSPVAAQNRPQLSEAEINAVALYSMPHVFRAVQTRCSASLPADAYMRTRGDALVTRLDRSARGTFPGARAAMTRLLASDNRQMATLIGQLPQENVEPLVRELIAGKVQSDLKLEDCGKIDRILALLEPLPPENLARLLGIFVLEDQARRAAAGATQGSR